MIPVTSPTPQALIQTPANHQTFFAPASITLSSVVTPTATNLVKVEYFEGTTFIGGATNEPYVFNWTNVQAGNYAISARTTTTSDATANSGIINITVVQLPTLRFTPTTTNFTVFWPTSSIGFSLESATNLNPPIDWAPVTDVVSTMGTNYGLTMDSPFGSRYFRLRRP
jgi:hypothetical protein